MLNDEHPVTLRRIRIYDDFEELLAHEDPAAIAPDLRPEELLPTLRQLYPPPKEALGAVALEVGFPRRYDTVLFDLGYTLIYFEPLQQIIAQDALRQIGLERSLDEIMAAVSVVWGSYYPDAATATFPATEDYDRAAEVELTRNLLSKLGFDADDETVAVYYSALEEWFSRPGVIRPYPEVTAVLETLKMRGYRLGIVSNWSWNLRDRVTQVELDRYFEVVWASAYAGCNKPNPDIFGQALALMDPPPSRDRTLYVGDSYKHDVVGARNAGISPVLLDRDGAAANPDCPTITDLWQLLPLLE
jgi:HAD superfamily hydrolase (TIGR01549 family)